MKMTIMVPKEVEQCAFCENPASPFHPEEDKYGVGFCEDCRAETVKAWDLPETKPPVFLAD